MQKLIWNDQFEDATDTAECRSLNLKYRKSE